MADCAQMPTPLPMKLDKVPGQEELFADPSYFRSLAGKLQNLTLTRPDLQFAVNFIMSKDACSKYLRFQFVKTNSSLS